MIYEVVEDRHSPGMWRVEAVDYGPPLGDGEGEIYVAIFSGPNAEGRAREYAIWKREKDKASRALLHR